MNQDIERKIPNKNSGRLFFSRSRSEDNFNRITHSSKLEQRENLYYSNNKEKISSKGEKKALNHLLNYTKIATSGGL